MQADAFRLAIILFSALTVLGCSQSARAPDLFGFISTCTSGDWEACRRRNNRLDLASTQSFQKMLNDAFDQAYSVSDLRRSTTRDEFDLVVVRDPVDPFLFESTTRERNGRTIRVIRTSSETFSTISKITIARHLPRLPKFQMDWIGHYLLYMRKSSSVGGIVDPLRASGLVLMAEPKRKPGTPDFSDALRDGINDTLTVVTFLVAHELFHLERPFHCELTADKCGPLRKRHETDADANAILLLQQLATDDPTPDHRLEVPIAVFAQLMLVLERATEHPTDTTNHPALHERLRAATLALDSWMNGKADNASIASLREFSELAHSTLSRIDSETPQKYFEGVDDEAKSASLESLKLY